MTESNALKRQSPSKKSNCSSIRLQRRERHFENFFGFFKCLSILSNAPSAFISSYFFRNASFSAFSFASISAFSFSSSIFRLFMFAAKFLRFSSCSNRDYNSSVLVISALSRKRSISLSDLCMCSLSRSIFNLIMNNQMSETKVNSD